MPWGLAYHPVCHYPMETAPGTKSWIDHSQFYTVHSMAWLGHIYPGDLWGVDEFSSNMTSDTPPANQYCVKMHLKELY